MYNRRKHTWKSLIKDYLDSENVKTTVAVLILELMLLSFGTYKGIGPVFLPVTLMVMLVSIFACVATFYFNADRLILIPLLILMDIGFLVQILQSPATFKFADFSVKFFVVILGTLLVVAGYRKLGTFISTDFITKCMMVLQYAISVLMLVLGSENGPKVSIRGITLFEFVKVMYIFVAVSLLCKPELEKMTLFKKLQMNRELVLLLHTGVLAVFFVLCSELGSLLVIYLTGISLAFLYSKHRRIVLLVISATFIGLAGVWIMAAAFYPKLLAGEISFPGVVEKVLVRFAVALHPEKYAASGGQQVSALQAIAVGGGWGIKAERARIPIPLGDTDMVVASIAQTCGFFMMLLIILAFVILYLRNHMIAGFCEDMYFKGLVEGIGTLISIETIIHIAYNNSIFPVTGIPCYFLSRSVTSLLTGCVLMAIVLVISTGCVERGEIE